MSEHQHHEPVKGPDGNWWVQLPHDIRITFRREPKPPRRHRVFDVCAILFASALIATAFGSGVVFAIVGSVCIVLYLVSDRLRGTGTA